ncbi:MAG: DUF3598 family protein [Cyanobacteria bacterium P01_D01_bin.105]
MASSISSDTQPLSQWQRLLKNAGTWQGSFTQVSPYGEILIDTPTEVALLPQGENQSAMRQEIRRYSNSPSPQTTVLEYSTLNRTILFFKDGAFSQGSAQWGPFSTFGTELGLISGNRRLRILQQFNTDSELDKITLIREQLQGSESDTELAERPPLTVESLIGTWEGEAITQYADLRPEQTYPTQLTIAATGRNQISQTLSFSSAAPPITSTGTLEGQRILFTQRNQPIQVLLLPDGGSSTCPVKITPRQPIYLEAGWLLDAHTRQRLIRQYDGAGAWVSLTLVTETKC